MPAKAKLIETGKPLLGPVRQKEFFKLLHRGVQQRPGGAIKRSTGEGREFPDAAIAALASLPDKSRLALTRKFLRLKHYAQDCRLLFGECLAVLKLARAADSKDASI